jgi:hypothetical protein
MAAELGVTDLHVVVGAEVSETPIVLPHAAEAIHRLSLWLLNRVTSKP